ncbi:ComF family protein [Puniceicoccales bacterium CK1056]|uniref:ComF family protein n=1 Tax=Oceanipulchritudo coccoides TaxID=2706888 RepID=A0A6B2LZY0_9BACT|nr:ComF family protein [Oceanipulchritudo coccoides]NDV61712.1 ComF family protein [Oceanipulchritudo coccoides]
MEWGSRGKSLWKRLLDIVFPRTCVQCGRYLEECGEVRFTCRACFEAYKFTKEPLCDQCGVPFYGKIAQSRKCAGCESAPPVFRQARSIFLYRDTGARVVHCLKYEKGSWLQPEITALVRADLRWKAYFEDAILVPVPLHFRKLQSRGYNQAEVIARAICEAVPSACINACLRRVRATPSQTFLSREQRKHNMSGAFSCVNPPEIMGRIIVVDDVLTTGATLNAAVQALNMVGLEDIYAFTLAHG